jgi:hypothetical protein
MVSPNYTIYALRAPAMNEMSLLPYQEILIDLGVGPLAMITAR